MVQVASRHQSPRNFRNVRQIVSLGSHFRGLRDPISLALWAQQVWKLDQRCKIQFYGGSLLWKKWLNCKESCENAEEGFFSRKSEMASLTAQLRSSRGRIKYRLNDLKFGVRLGFGPKNWMDIGTSIPQNFRSAYWATPHGFLGFVKLIFSFHWIAGFASEFTFDCEFIFNCTWNLHVSFISFPF